MGFRAGTKAGARGIRAAGSVAIELVSRLVRLPTAMLTLFGSRGTRSVHLRVLILRRPDGTPLTTPDQVMPAIERGNAFLQSAANIRLLPTGGLFVTTVDECGAGVPEQALCQRGGGGALRDYLGTPGGFLDLMIHRYHKQTSFPRNLLATPVTCFIVDDLGGLRGNAIPVLGNWFAIVAHGLAPVHNAAGEAEPPSIIAHEVGHCLGLYAHHDDPRNLMHAPDVRGAALTRWQRIVARSGRCVSFW